MSTEYTGYREEQYHDDRYDYQDQDERYQDDSPWSLVSENGVMPGFNVTEHYAVYDVIGEGAYGIVV